MHRPALWLLLLCMCMSVDCVLNTDDDDNDNKVGALSTSLDDINVSTIENIATGCPRSLPSTRLGKTNQCTHPIML